MSDSEITWNKDFKERGINKCWIDIVEGSTVEGSTVEGSNVEEQPPHICYFLKE